jgi:hypothetical protein
MKRIFIALTVALVLLRFGFSLAVAARDEPVALGAGGKRRSNRDFCKNDSSE